MTPEMQAILGWIIGLPILTICFFIACIYTAEPIDETHPDALGSLDVRDGIGRELAESDAHESRREERMRRTTTP